MISLHKTSAFMIAIFVISSLSYRAIAQTELPVHVEHFDPDSYIMTSEYSYKNIAISSIYYGSPDKGTFDPGPDTYYYFDGKTKTQSSLEGLFNSKSSELLNLINAAFKSQFNDLKNSENQDIRTCAENLGDFKPYSFKNMTLSFEIDSVNQHAFAAFSIQELGMMWNCKFCDHLSFVIELTEFDKYLK